MKSFGISIKGSSHKKKGLPNQDAFLIKKLEKGLVAVVADGLGSKKHSNVGSKKACEAVANVFFKLERENNSYCSKDNLKELLPLIYECWINSLGKYCANDSSSTCLFAYICDEDIIVAQLGDGMIFLLGKDEEGSILIQDDKEEGFINMTDCLNARFAIEKWKIKSVPKTLFKALFICSDGISSDIKDGMQKDFVKELMHSSSNKTAQQNKKGAKRWLKNWPIKSNTDDKTLVFVEL